jgi:hypothetical protein
MRTIIQVTDPFMKIEIEKNLRKSYERRSANLT